MSKKTANENTLDQIDGLIIEYNKMYNVKSIQIKQEIDTANEQIKTKSFNLYNELLDQQVDLLYKVDEIKNDLNNKLDTSLANAHNIKTKLDQIINLNDENELERINAEIDKQLNELNQIDFNYEFKPNKINDDTVLIGTIKEIDPDQTEMDDNSNGKILNLFL